MNQRCLYFIILFMVLNDASASGLSLYETATEDIGLAGAGSAARAQDASTVLTNPAGMTRLPENMIIGGVQLLYGDARYSMDNDAALKGNDPGNVIGWFPATSMFYVKQASDMLALGVGIYGNYGLGLDYGSWAGDSLVQKSTLLGMTLSPAAAIKLSERLSWGVGLGINYGFLSLTRRVDDGSQKQSDHDWALNFRTGLLFDFNEHVRGGVTYTSETRYHFNIDGNVLFPDISSIGYELPINAQVNSPQQLMLSVVNDINSQWSIMGNLGWQDWSRYGASIIRVGETTLVGSHRLQDTWHTAFAVQYRPNTQWRFNSGIAYDSSIYKDQNDASLTMPTGDAWRFGIGTQYQLTPAQSIGLAAEYLTMETSRVKSSLVKGSYNIPYILFFSLNYSYSF